MFPSGNYFPSSLYYPNQLQLYGPSKNCQRKFPWNFGTKLNVWKKTMPLHLSSHITFNSWLSNKQCNRTSTHGKNKIHLLFLEPLIQSILNGLISKLRLRVLLPHSSPTKTNFNPGRVDVVASFELSQSVSKQGLPWTIPSNMIPGCRTK